MSKEQLYLDIPDRLAHHGDIVIKIIGGCVRRGKVTKFRDVTSM